MFTKFKERLAGVSEHGLGIPITSQMLEKAIQMKAKDVQDVKVEIVGHLIILHGKITVTKMMMKKDIVFRATLKPISLEGRTILMELEDVKPLNISLINRIILNKPPFAEYRQKMIKLDLNAWEKIKNVPFGKLKSFEMKKDAILVKVWI
ncbi:MULTISPECIES: hypothetical protein [Bacillaceae]|uniref:Uncharacterized protein n=1 Tax=Metabacillus sediminis TaxID=3117746 RepID=A0ABZ2NM65_9BACI|nr:hypothetical protein [Bacillus sp. SJS]KZZ83636.1 hypothetical protein AS29_015125 [Bacillus sp. SJS]